MQLNQIYDAIENLLDEPFDFAQELHSENGMTGKGLDLRNSALNKSQSA